MVGLSEERTSCAYRKGEPNGCSGEGAMGQFRRRAYSGAMSVMRGARRHRHGNSDGDCGMALTAMTSRRRDAATVPHPDDLRAHWRRQFRSVRAETEARAARLSDEDQLVQSMADASPVKWHRGHVTWFFEQFLLVPHDPCYAVFDTRFSYLFNSYYIAAGPRHA